MWNDAGEMVAILSESSFYVLRFDREAVDAAFESGAAIDEDGIEEAFELLNEVSEHVRTGQDFPLCSNLPAPLALPSATPTGLGSTA